MNEVVDPDEVTADWLSEVLDRAGLLSGASVTSCSTERLVAMSFTGVLQRVQLDYDRDLPQLPRSLVAKFSAADTGLRDTVSSMGFYEREVSFYRDLAGTTPVPVPSCYHAAVDGEDGRCVILLEDLTSSRPGRTAGACSIDDIRAAVDAVAALHASRWETPTDDLPGWLDPDTFATPTEVASAFADLWPAFLAKLSIPISDQIRRFGDWATNRVEPVMRRMYHDDPLTVVHNDYQADNLLFGSGPEHASVIVLDWQLVSCGRGPLDLAYLLSGSMTTDDRRRYEREILDRYTGAVRGSGLRDYDPADCLSDYRAALVLPPTRLACAVAMSPELVPQPGSFWEVLFPRQLAALVDNGLLES